MSPIQVLLALHIISMCICTFTCLPITSKPIENTPEHLAWEAWIMVPPTHDKTRKITPKSIFILPNKTNGGGNGGSNTQQIQCPPGHRVDNFRCIPTVNIDRDQILIAQLTNLLHSTDKYNSQNGQNNESTYSYEYDYDYGDGYDPEVAESLYQAGKVPPDYNGEPLKINLSLGKFPTTKDENKETGNFGVGEDVDDTYDELKVQPFRAQETSSTTTNAPTSSDLSSTTLSSTTITSTKASEDRTQQIGSEVDLSNSSHNFSESSSTAATHTSTPSVLILSPAETEIASITPTSKTESDTDFDYSFTDQTTSRTTSLSDGEMDIVTETAETKTDLKDDLIEESLVFDKIGIENSTQLEQSTDVDFTTTTIINQEDFISQTEIVNQEFRSSTKKLEEHTLPPMQNETVDKSDNKTRQELKMSDHKTGGIESKTGHGRRNQEPIRVQEEQEPVLESIESNNRFVYHHLGSNFRQYPDKVQPTTPDIQEQLRIINRIVEENKRRAQQQHERIRFPTESEEQERRENYRDYIRFPDHVASHVSSSQPSRPQPHEFRTEHFPIHKKFPEWMHQPTIITPASPPDSQQNQKPFWWLPNGWEVDRKGDRPLLLRFWSRAPTEQDPSSRPRTSSSSSTSGYRENSRSPTENLYKEISAQEVYKVLGAKQWKHNR